MNACDPMFCHAPRGTACSNSRPPPPPDPPKVFEPVFLQFEILGERVGAKGAEIFFFLPFLRGVLFSPYVSILKIRRILWRIQKCLKNTENFLTPDLTSGSDLG